ncbi:ATP-dependent DNA helicase Q-like 5-like protein [Drosera capensis]
MNLCFRVQSILAVSTRCSCDWPKLRPVFPQCQVFLQGNSHAKLTPRAVARIMHRTGSPAYPSATWSKSHFWGRYTQMDLKKVMEAAKAELMNVVAKDAVH